MHQHLFISYARVDGDIYASNLYRELTEDGYSVWFDLKNIPSGSDWDTEIDKGLQNAQAILVIMTPGSVNSLQVKSEWNYALNRNMPILPLLYETCEIPRLLSVFNYIDFINSGIKAYRSLNAKLQTLKQDHLEYLTSTLKALQIAQQESSKPKRFQPKIDDLSAAITNWGGRLENQESRIAQGLKEQSLNRLNIDDFSESTRLKRMQVVGKRPIDVTDLFKDRVRERHEIRDILESGNKKIISVIGRGGIGKTAIACKVLHDMTQDYSNNGTTIEGIAYLSTRTSGITIERIYFDAAILLGTLEENRLMDIWGIVNKPLDEKIEALLRAFSQNNFVMLLDNMEDILLSDGTVIDSGIAMFIEKVSILNHNFKLLITSRVPLSLSRGAAFYEQRVHLMEGLPLGDSVQLLRDLDSNDEYSLYSADENDLRQLSILVHGVPRALEVATGILANDPFMSIDNLIANFYNDQDAIRDLIEEGYKRLDSDARHVMEALAIFRRPVSVLAIDYLLEPFFAGLDVPSIIRRLNRTHIINVDRKSKTVSLHPIDRDYALSQIPTNGNYNSEFIHLRAAMFYETQQKPPGDYMPYWHSYDDIQEYISEFEHLIKGGMYDKCIHILVKIHHFMHRNGYITQIRRMLNELDDKLTNNTEKMIYHRTKAIVMRFMGADNQSVVEEFKKAIEISNVLEDSSETIMTIAEAAYYNIFETESTSKLAEAVEKLKIHGQDDLMVTYMSLLVIKACKSKNIAQGLYYANQLKKISNKSSNQLYQAYTSNAFAIIALQMRRYDEVVNHCNIAINNYKNSGNDVYTIPIQNMKALAEFELNRSGEAIITFKKSVQYAQKYERVDYLLRSLFNLTYVFLSNEQFKEAESLFLDINKYKAETDATKAIKSLRQALINQSAGDQRGFINALFECALKSQDNPDLIDSRTIAAHAYKIAITQNMKILASDIQNFITRYETELILPD